MGFVDPFYAYYDSKLLKRRSPHVPPERLEKDIAEYQKLGVRILGVYPPTLAGRGVRGAPDWRRSPPTPTEIPEVDLKQHPHGGMLCLLGPYGDFFIDVLAEIVTKFPGRCLQLRRAAPRRRLLLRALPQELQGRHRQGDPERDMNDPEFRRTSTGPTASSKTSSAGCRRGSRDQAGRRARDLDDQRRPLRALLEHPAEHAGPDEPAVRRPGPGVLAGRDQPRQRPSCRPSANAYIWAVTNHRVAFSEPYLMSHGNPTARTASRRTRSSGG
jgi:hypothetical protein